jgi:hypothetical protein
MIVLPASTIPPKRSSSFTKPFSERTRSVDALDIDVPHERPIGVAVEDTDDLVHPSAAARVFRLQAGSRKGLVDIACDRPRFVQAKPVVLEGGDLSEGVRAATPPAKISIGTSSYWTALSSSARRTPRALGRTRDDRMTSSLHRLSLKRSGRRPNANPLADSRVGCVRMATADAGPCRPLRRRPPPPRRPLRRNGRGRTFCAHHAHGSSAVSGRPR